MSRYHRVSGALDGIRLAGFRSPDDEDYYMSEACAYFALALHGLHGYPLRILVDEGTVEGGMPTVAHVYAVDSKGDAVDIKGHRSQEEVRGEFWDLAEPATYSVTPEELRRDWMGDDKPLHAPSESEVAEARAVILAEPAHDTPWPAPSVTAYHALSRLAWSRDTLEPGTMCGRCGSDLDIAGRAGDEDHPLCKACRERRETPATPQEPPKNWWQRWKAARRAFQITAWWSREMLDHKIGRLDLNPDDSRRFRALCDAFLASTDWDYLHDMCYWAASFLGAAARELGIPLQVATGRYSPEDEGFDHAWLEDASGTPFDITAVAHAAHRRETRSGDLVGVAEACPECDRVEEDCECEDGPEPVERTRRFSDEDAMMDAGYEVAERDQFPEWRAEFVEPGRYDAGDVGELAEGMAYQFGFDEEQEEAAREMARGVARALAAEGGAARRAALDDPHIRAQADPRVRKIMAELVDLDGCESWKEFVDHQEMGGCQNIVPDIARMNLPGVVPVFGDIRVDEPSYIQDDDEYNDVFPHHWVTIDGEVFDFSKGTLLGSVEWDDVYDPESADDRYDFRGAPGKRSGYHRARRMIAGDTEYVYHGTSLTQLEAIRDAGWQARDLYLADYREKSEGYAERQAESESGDAIPVVLQLDMAALRRMGQVEIDPGSGPEEWEHEMGQFIYSGPLREAITNLDEMVREIRDEWGEDFAP